MAESNEQICVRLKRLSKIQENGKQRMASLVGDHRGKISNAQDQVRTLERQEIAAENAVTASNTPATLGGRLNRLAVGGAGAAVLRTEASIRLSNIRAKLEDARSKLARLIREKEKFQREYNNFAGNLPTTKAELRARGCPS